MMFSQALLLNLFLINFQINDLVCGANILAITTLPSPSHHIFNDVYLMGLVKKGHNVTLLGHDKDKHGHPNYTHIVMEGVYEQLKQSFNLMELEQMSCFQTISILGSFADLVCELDQQTDGLKKLTQYPDDFKFDLIVWDFNAGYCHYSLIEKFGRPPIIVVNPFILQPNIFKNVWQSYIPFIAYPYTDHMTFLQRLKSNFFSLLLEVMMKYQFLPSQQKLAENYYGKSNLTIEEFERSVSIVLTNHHPVFNYAEALPPNIIPVGGLHIQPKHLPDNFKNLLDNSKNGAILFSLGSNIPPEEIGEKRIQAIINCFKRLKQTVIWKFQGNVKNLPKNVHIHQWLPQNDILGHPNTVLFITHGGLLSSHETVYNGVPVVEIPFFLDQFMNVENLVSKGLGEKIEFGEITEETLYNTIQKILNDKPYFNKAKTLSELYKDRQNDPLDTAIYWTEYILKHKTAAHLDLATRDMTLFKMLNLDLIFFTVFIAIVFIAFVSSFINLIFKFIRVVKGKAAKKIKLS